MGLEMAGVRVLNVYFGSTHYVWGAIIGVFLGALTLGYHLGGRVADRQPRYGVLGGIILAAAALVGLIPWMAPPLCRALASQAGQDPRVQALAASVLLYLAPCALLGMVTPCALRLAAGDVVAVGRVAGDLYALATIGSITGTWLVAFFLVEWIGNRATILVLGGCLVLAGAIAVGRAGRWKGAGIALGGAAVLAILAFAGHDPGVPAGPAFSGWRAIAELDSAFHHILVAEGPSWYPRHAGVPARYLLFNDQVQGGLELDHQVLGPASAVDYTDSLHLGLLFRASPARRALVIGCGAGLGPLEFRHDYPSLERIDVVDIDPAVFRLARTYFCFPAEGADPVLRAHLGDGRQFLRRAGRTYDYVVLDAYTAGGLIPFHLTTREFFAEVKAALAPGGVAVVNLISARTGPDGRLYRAVARTLDAVFPRVYAFPKADDAATVDNILLVATREPRRWSRPELEERRRRMQGRESERAALARYLPGMVQADGPFQGDPILTDDFAPTDSMAAR
jgi:spermidine synthase